MPSVLSFVHIDLAPRPNQKPDFSDVALQPGRPVLDDANANCYVLMRWLGPLVAEADRKGSRIDFYLRDDRNSRVPDAFCSVVSDSDLDGDLKADLALIESKLKTATPKNNSEREVLKYAVDEMAALREARKKDRRFYFMKWRDAKKKWHLVWCPGFVRTDSQPAAPVICTSKCQLYFLNRTSATPRCPECHGATIVKKKEPSRTPWGKLIAVLLIAAVGGGLWWVANNRPDLINPIKPADQGLAISPDSWTGPVDSKVEFTVKRPGTKGQEDVTAATRAIVDDPRILAFDDLGLAAIAKSPGKTKVTFTVGELTRQIEVTVEPPVNPKELALEPEKLEVAVDAQVAWKLKGRFDNGRTADLTAAAEFPLRSDAPFFVDRGLVRGLEAGEGKLLVRYRATAASEYMSKEIPVTVVEKPFKSLELAVAPANLPVGQIGEISVTAIADDGSRNAVTGTEKLELDVTPKSNATIEGRRLRGLATGTAKLSAKFKGLTANLDVAIVDHASEMLAVHPKTLTLRVGEIVEVQVSAAANPPYRMVSSVPAQVEVNGRSRLIGRAVGSGEVQVVQGDQSVKLDVTVVAADFTSLAIDPPHLSVPVDDSKQLRVVAESQTGPRAEIAPDQLQWVTLPPPEIAQVDRQGPRIRGMQATNEPAELGVKFGELLARGEVEVTSVPPRLELTPAGTIELPVGQKLELKAVANYPEGRTAYIPADRLEWEVDSIAGLRFGAGIVEASKPGVGPLKIKAVYQGRTSNSVEVNSIEAEEVTLKLEAVNSSISPGEAGSLKLTGTGRHGPVQLSLDGVVFESGSPDIVAVDAASGAFRGNGPGKATLTAKHPLVAGPASCEVIVTEGSAKVASVRLLTTVEPPIKLPIGTIFTEFRVEATDSAGATRDVTADATVTLESEGDPAPLVVYAGKIVAQTIGTGRLKASYEGVAAPEVLDIEVVGEVDIDELTIAPASLELAVGESAAVRALAWKKGRIVGDITNRSDLTWKSSEKSIATADGPNISGVAVGRSSITAEVAGMTSKPLAVTITASPRGSRRLVVTPSSMTMGLDETRHIGTDITVTRDGADVTSQCQVTTSAPNIVGYRRGRDMLTARGAGRARITFILGADSVPLDIQVEPRRRATNGKVQLVVQPSHLNLAVGQEGSIRVFRVAENGQRADVTDSALLSSSADSIASVSGRGVLGVSPGTADISVRIADVEAPVTVKAIVADEPFSSLEVIPIRVALSVGERRTLTVTAITKNGRLRLGSHPDLKLTVGGPKPESVQIEPGNTLVGAQPGAATVTVQWRDGLSKQVPVVVTADALRDLVIEPSQAAVAVGETINYQVFARRGGSLVPLDSDNGVRLQVRDNAVATVEGSTGVRGRSPGVTEVIARVGNLSARAALTVSPTTAASGSAQGTAPAARPVGLEFIPSSTRVELGYPGNRIRVIRVLANGQQEDVDHLATLTVRDPQDVVSITKGPSGPLVAPRKIGQTQIDAELDGLKTSSPLLVDVVERLPSTATVRISPNPLVIREGATGEFSRVEIVPASGGSPIELPYKLSATPNPIFRVEPDNKIVATAPGQAIAAVTIVDPNGKYDGLYSSATVEVPGSAAAAGRTSLRLTGPSETTVGAEVPFLVELVGGGTSVDVTNNETTLVLQQDQSDMAEVRAGCRLIAKKPGRVTLQAKHRDNVSNSHTLVIRPLSDFARLELEVDNSSMHVGDSRSYKLWGHPRDGGTRQDLTASVSENGTGPQVKLTVTLPNPGTQVAVHEPPSVIARQPGQFSLQGSLGVLTTQPVTLEVSGPAPTAAQLKAEPSTLTLRVGETSAPVQISARSKGDRGFRPIEAQWETLNASIATLESGAPAGRIKAVGIGNVQVRATYGGLSTLVDVKVVGDRFRSIGEGRLVNVGKQTFSIELDIQSDRSEGEIEYRFVRSDKEASQWIKAQPNAEGAKATITSPSLKLGPPTELYQLVIEARDSKDKSVENYPYYFRIVPGVTRVNQQK